MRRHSLTSMRLLLLLSDIGQPAYPRRAYRIVSSSWHSSSTRPPVTAVTAPAANIRITRYSGSRDHTQNHCAARHAGDPDRHRRHQLSLHEHRAAALGEPPARHHAYAAARPRSGAALSAMNGHRFPPPWSVGTNTPTKWESEAPAVSPSFLLGCGSIALFKRRTTLDHCPQPAERG